MYLGDYIPLSALCVMHDIIAHKSTVGSIIMADLLTASSMLQTELLQIHIEVTHVRYTGHAHSNH